MSRLGRRLRLSAAPAWVCRMGGTSAGEIETAQPQPRCRHCCERVRCTACGKACGVVPPAGGLAVPPWRQAPRPAAVAAVATPSPTPTHSWPNPNPDFTVKLQTVLSLRIDDWTDAMRSRASPGFPGFPLVPAGGPAACVVRGPHPVPRASEGKAGEASGGRPQVEPKPRCFAHVLAAPGGGALAPLASSDSHPAASSPSCLCIPTLDWTR